MSKSADRLLVDQYIAEIRANTVTRSCMCCLTAFETDQAYRLCEVCRDDGPVMDCIPTPAGLFEAA